jgi:hypothetical protein
MAGAQRGVTGRESIEGFATERWKTLRLDLLRRTLKSALVGRVAHFETRVEPELGAIADRIPALEKR